MRFFLYTVIPAAYVGTVQAQQVFDPDPAVTGAIGTVIFVAYLSALCKNPLHTATQYALLTALASVGRIYLSSASGYVAEATGWPQCTPSATGDTHCTSPAFFSSENR